MGFIMLIKELYWIAGFLEGEGCFYYSNSSVISANQVQQEPLLRLQKLLGGSLYRAKARPKPCQRIYVWTITGQRAVAIMMTVFSLMSPKRKKAITKAISRWKKAALHNKYKTHCPKGHLYKRIKSNGRRACVQC